MNSEDTEPPAPTQHNDNHTADSATGDTKNSSTLAQIQSDIASRCKESNLMLIMSSHKDGEAEM